MIEEKIDRLIETMETLTAVLKESGVGATVPAKKETVKKEKETVKKEKETEPVTEKDLQNICLTIVRKDKTKKAKIKTILKKYGGELIKDIDEEKYSEIKTALEAL